MYCPNCGKKVKPGAKFCPYCGIDLTKTNKTSQQKHNFNQPISNQNTKPVSKKSVSYESTPARKNQGQNRIDFEQIDREQERQNRNSHIRNVCLMVVAIILVIAAMVTVFFTIQSQNQNQKVNTATSSHPRSSRSSRFSSKKSNSNNTDSDNNDSDSSDDDSSDSDSSSSKDNRSDNSLAWNDTKEQKLADFMNDFGDEMDQDYDEYTGDSQLKTLAGEKYPSILSEEPFVLFADGTSKTEKIDIGWDPKLTKDYDYHVVSIFNYNKGNPEQHITYLFCIHDNEPVALVDETTNGNSIRVKETANQHLRTGYANIVKGID